MNTGYILGVSRGHNSGVCLLHNGKIVFAIEEERISRKKYDGSPLASMMLVKQYTNWLDKIIIVHTAPLLTTSPMIEYTGDDIYTGLARKLGLISRDYHGRELHPQVLDYSHIHHKTHAACAFFRSGFDEAVAVVIDGAGSNIPLQVDDKLVPFWEVESIFDCSYPCNLKTLYKHFGTKDPIRGAKQKLPLDQFGEGIGEFEALVTDSCGITKTYEAVTEYCGFSAIEAGKTMGLFPYGKENDQIPNLFENINGITFANKHVFVPNYPNGAYVNQNFFPYLVDIEDSELSKNQNRRDMAYAVQKQTQEEALKVILKAVEMSGKKNVVLSGGYGLNCVANYYFLDRLRQEGINLYVEPVSNDGGTAIGAALHYYYETSGSLEKQSSTVYLGPGYMYDEAYIDQLIKFYDGEVLEPSYEKVVELLRNKNIVCLYQGKSENGPRALGNRSILFDPTFEDGKDFVNQVKRREYFRPFAGSILHKHVHDWFDLRGMDESPYMMYAVNCQPGIEEKIPSIIHIDGTCRIQTVKKEQNPAYYELIEEFYKQTGVPILFNTSFNLGGDPLVETLEDAVETLARSDLEYLFLPEYNRLIYIKNKPKACCDE